MCAGVFLTLLIPVTDAVDEELQPISRSPPVFFQTTADHPPNRPYSIHYTTREQAVGDARCSMGMFLVYQSQLTTKIQVTFKLTIRACFLLKM